MNTVEMEKGMVGKCKKQNATVSSYVSILNESLWPFLFLQYSISQFKGVSRHMERGWVGVIIILNAVLINCIRVGKPLVYSYPA